MVSILVKNGTVLTMDRTRRAIRNGAVAIDGNKIVAVGKTETLEKSHKGEVTINAQNKLVLPGFVNVHTHAATTYLKGVTEDMPGALHQVLWPMKQFLNDQRVHAMGMLGLLELVKSGSTTVAENYNMIRNGLAKAAETIGLRAVLSEQVIDADLTKTEGGIKGGFYTYEPDIGKRTLREAVRVVDEWNGKAGGRITCMIGPLAPDVCSKELLQGSRKEAVKRKVGLTIHLSQSRAEILQVGSKYGKSPVQHLADIGFLGPDVVAAHCIYTTDADTKILKDTDTKIAHCPSNMIIRGSDKMAPLLHWLQAGITFGLGTDNPPAAHDILVSARNMKTVAWRNINASPYHSSFARQNPSGAMALEMITIKGAKVLHMEDKIGSIEVGKMADLVLLDMGYAHIGPTNNDITANLVYYATGNDVDTVIVDGQIIKQDGVVKCVDEKQVVAEALEMNEQLWTDFFEANPKLRPKLHFNYE